MEKSAPLRNTVALNFREKHLQIPSTLGTHHLQTIKIGLLFVDVSKNYTMRFVRHWHTEITHNTLAKND